MKNGQLILLLAFILACVSINVILILVIGAQISLDFIQIIGNLCLLLEDPSISLCFAEFIKGSALVLSIYKNSNNNLPGIEDSSIL